jgi:opacity protein-like surface antigen
MKKILLVIVLLFALIPASSASAVDTWYKTLTGTVAWDVPTTYEDGSAIDPADVLLLSYNVYMKNVTTGVQTKIGSTSASSMAIVIPSRGKYRLGVQTQLSETEQSVIGWSDDPVICSTAGTFGFRLMFPAGAKGLKKQ